MEENEIISDSVQVTKNTIKAHGNIGFDLVSSRGAIMQSWGETNCESNSS